jgi:tRNA threonylcarbamoyl adenosine modification protein YjeE
MPMTPVHVTVRSPDETEALATRLAPYVLAGDVFALQGPLGAGKSLFARALLRAMGSRQAHMPSPTFTLLQAYDDTRLPAAHVDFYRLEGESDTDPLDLGPWFKHGVTLIEWPEKAPRAVPATALTVRIAPGATDDERHITLEGASWQGRMGFLDPLQRRPVTEKGRAEFVQKTTGRKGCVLTAVSADASFRSYWRTRLPEVGSRVIMDAPPPLENVSTFVAIARHLEKVGLHPPHVYAVDEKNGYALLEDFGDTTFYAAFERDKTTIQPLYEKAVDVLVHLAKAELANVRAYTTDMYQTEVCLFTDWYLPKLTGLATHTADRAALQNLMADLVDRHIRPTPRTTILGDYHIQNLMVVGKLPVADITQVGLLDFQDARIGTVAYDLVSLLYDVRFDVPPELRPLLIKRFVDGLDGAVTMADFRRAFNLSGVQNLMRIVGVFTRLVHRDKKAGYLRFMPRVWTNLDELLAAPECEPLRTWMHRNVPADRALPAA